MSRIDEFKKHHGEKISKELLDEIMRNYRISHHAQEQLSKRSDMFVPGNLAATKMRVNEKLIDNILAYFNTDGSVNIAINEWNYFVFCYDENRMYWNMVTFKEQSWYGKNIFEKREMAINGFDRKY